MSRARIAVKRALSDAKNPSRGVSYGDILNGPSAETPNYVSDVFLKNARCNAAFQKMIDHPFCTAMGNGTALLDGFRYYMIQDFIYLKHYAYFKLEVYMKGSLADFKSSKSHAEGDIDYAQDLLNTITTNLGVTVDDVQNTEASNAIKSYIELEDTINTGDETDWLKVHVLLLPCILGYYKIADRLINNVSILRDTIYYTYWIEPNHDPGSVKSYIDFINQNWAPFIEKKARTAEDKQKVTQDLQDLFISACEKECLTFDTGIYPSIAPNVLRTYDILPKSNKGRLIQSATSSSGHNLVVIAAESKKVIATQIPENHSPRANQNWIITKTLKGHTIQLEQDLSYHLAYSSSGAIILENFSASSEVKQSAYWFIIPSVVADSEGIIIENAYQIIPASLTVTSKQDNILSLTTTQAAEIVLKRNIISKVQGKRDQVWIIKTNT